MDEVKPLEPIAPKTKFSWARVVKTVLIIVVVAAVLGGIYFLVGYRPVKVAWASLVLDRHENYLPCEQLPFLDAVKMQMTKHADIIAKMKALGASSVTAEQINCASSFGFYFVKGQMVIEYGNRQQRQAIEHLIGDNFFGIAYRGEPVK